MTKLTGKELRQLNDIWLNYWDQSPAQFKGGNAEHWYTTVTDFLKQRGDELITSELRQREYNVMQAGLSQEYMAALREVVDARHARSDFETAILVVTASPEEREEALNKVVRK